MLPHLDAQTPAGKWAAPWRRWPLSVVLGGVAGAGAVLGSLFVRRRTAPLAGTVGEEEALRESEARYFELYQNAPDMLISLEAPSGAILAFNRTLLERTGYLESELLGKPALEFVGPESSDAAWEAWTLVLETGGAESMMVRIRRADGSTFPAAANAVGVRDEGGAVVGVRISARDISEEVELSRRLDRILEGTQDGLWEWPNMDRPELWWSDRIFSLLGFEPQEFSPTLDRVAEMVHPADREALDRTTRATLREAANPFTSEYRIRGKDGRYRWVQARGRVYQDGEGNPSHMAGSVRDITEYRTAQEALQDQRDQAALYLDTAEVMLVALDREGRIAMINRKGSELLGRPPEELVGRDWFDTALPPELREEVRRIFQRLMTGEMGSVRYAENEILTAAGERRLMAWRNALTRDSRGALTGTLSSGEDITEYRRTQVALREALEWQEVIFHGSQDAVFISDTESRFVQVNRAAAALTGYSEGELLGMTIPDLHEDIDLEAYRLHHHRIMGGEPALTFSQLLRKDGTKVEVEFNNRLLVIGDKAFMHTVARDVTERQRMERALKDSRSRLRALAARLEAVREEERLTLARELHDQVGQALTALRMDLGFLLSEEGPATGEKPTIEGLIEAADETLELVRALSSRLRPPILDVMGLGPALEWYVEERCERAGLACQVEVPEDAVRLPPGVAIAVFRIAQEALTNILRHAGATHLRVTFREEAGWGTLEVEDDGRGIREEETRSPKALGIMGMQERALGLGGSLTLESLSPRGTLLRLRVLVPEGGSAGRAP